MKNYNTAIFGILYLIISAFVFVYVSCSNNDRILTPYITDHLQFMGRFELIKSNKTDHNCLQLNSSDSNCYIIKSDWSGSEIKFGFDNSNSIPEEVSINIKFGDFYDSSFYVSININCKFYNKFALNPQNNSIAFTLPVDPNNLTEISMTKITEAMLGIMTVEKIEINGANIQLVDQKILEIQSCNKRPHKLLVYGDSVSSL